MHYCVSCLSVQPEADPELNSIPWTHWLGVVRFVVSPMGRATCGEERRRWTELGTVGLHRDSFHVVCGWLDHDRTRRRCEALAIVG